MVPGKKGRKVVANAAPSMKQYCLKKFIDTGQRDTMQCSILVLG